MSMQSKTLFDATKSVGPYPKGVVAVREQLDCTAFFPGGYGLWDPSNAGKWPPWPHGKVMVLGQDFHSERGYKKSASCRGWNLGQPTWQNLRKRFEKQMPFRNCFFANLFMGLRKDPKSTGRFPGAKDSDFVGRCLEFLEKQVGTQRPRLLVTLGVHVLRTLGKSCIEEWKGICSLRRLDTEGRALLPTVRLFGRYPVTIVALTHPSSWVVHRRYKDLHDKEAEKCLLHDAMAKAGLPAGKQKIACVGKP